MNWRFRKHYTLAEARALLPQIRQWLGAIHQLRRQLRSQDEKISAILERGDDAGGDAVNRQIAILAELKELLLEFQRREIQIKDLDRGLLDFPAMIKGREVFLCWESDEDDIEFWHDLDTGYAGREKLRPE